MTDLSRTERFLSSLSFVNYFIRKKCQHYFLEKKDLTEALGKDFVILQNPSAWDFGQILGNYLETAQPQIWFFFQKQLIFTETCKIQL